MNVFLEGVIGVHWAAGRSANQPKGTNKVWIEPAAILEGDIWFVEIGFMCLLGLHLLFSHFKLISLWLTIEWMWSDCPNP